MAKHETKLLGLLLLATPLSGILFMMSYPWSLRWVPHVFGIACVMGLLAFLVFSIVAFSRKNRSHGCAFLAGLPLALVLIFIAALTIADPYPRDRFNDGLKLPEGVQLAVPEFGLPDPYVPGGSADTFQAAVRKALAIPGGDDSALAVAVPSLERLRKDQPALLDRYLAAHPAWRVCEEQGTRLARRRWVIGEQWQMSPQGFYCQFFETDGPCFQTRTTIHFPGKPSKSIAHQFPADTLTPVKLKPANQLWESAIAVAAGDLVIGQFEQSSAKERRITRAAFAELEREFAALVAQPTWDNAQKLLPPHAIIRGESSLELSDEYGTYRARIRCNPGTPGRVYLKAFEITRSYPLSADSLKTETNEWVGWSNDPQDQFLSETHFMIHEGDLGKSYGARFEVWFQPDGGAPERKLIERNFKIEGGDY